MSANCPCCIKTLNVGCFNSCQAFELTGILADITDNFSFEIEFNGRLITFKQIVAIGVEFSIPEQYVNQNYQHVVKIYHSDGTPFTWTVGPDVYDCFSFNTTSAISTEPFVFEGEPLNPPV